jgi:hypothetical protein
MNLRQAARSSSVWLQQARRHEEGSKGTLVPHSGRVERRLLGEQSGCIDCGLFPLEITATIRYDNSEAKKGHERTTGTLAPRARY